MPFDPVDPTSGRPEWPLLDRFLAGECSAAEIDRVRRWLDEQPDAAAELNLFRSAIGDNGNARPEELPMAWDIERAWSRLNDVTREDGDADAGARHRLPPPFRRVEVGEAEAAEAASPTLERAAASFNIGRTLRPLAPRWFRIAAALTLVAGGTGLVVWRWSGGTAHRAVAAASSRVITTQRSERADLRLADGTHVVLAPESRLTIPADFGRARREIALTGEGYFDVAHDPAKPFFVRAAHGLVHDLGTKFSVRAYPGDSAVRVVVADGRVVAGLASAALPLRGPVLGRGDLARIDTAGALILTHGVAVDRYQSWVDGRLRFDAMPLRDVLAELARWYDMDAELADSAVGNRRLTLTVRDEPVAQVLSAIAQITNTRYEQSGRVVRFVALSPTPPLAPRK